MLSKVQKKEQVKRKKRKICEESSIFQAQSVYKLQKISPKIPKAKLEKKSKGK